MRIAFVGKGGSGKTTLTALFSLFVAKEHKPLCVFDGDLNMHLPELLGFEPFPITKHLSRPEPSRIIKTYLKGSNQINDLNAFRKTTPPTKRSKLISIGKLNETPLADFMKTKNSLNLFVVGTYEEDEIGASCYHNNLAILENILSHMIDKGGYIVSDMVAGVDAFANTLHSQFDIICLIVEPTKRSIDVFEKYHTLAKGAGVHDNLIVIGNKIRSKDDENFIRAHIPEDKIAGFFLEDKYLRKTDQTGEPLDVNCIDKKNIKLLESLLSILRGRPHSPDKRLKKLWQLHKKYVAQKSITERFGDLTSQIDTSFRFDHD
jgi:CO dehydrogenase maturation factor